MGESQAMKAENTKTGRVTGSETGGKGLPSRGDPVSWGRGPGWADLEGRQEGARAREQRTPD